MFKRIKLILVFILLQIIVFSSINVGANALNNNVPKDLIITEIAPFGSTNSINNCRANDTVKFNCSMDKWVEIYNPTNSSIDLSKYSLYFGTGQDEGYFRSVTLANNLESKAHLLVKNKNISIISMLNNFNTIQEFGLLQNMSSRVSSSDGALKSKVKIGLKNNTLNTFIVQISDTYSCNSISSLEFINYTFSCSTQAFKINESSNMFATPNALSNLQHESFSLEKTTDTVHVQDPKVSSLPTVTNVTNVSNKIEVDSSINNPAVTQERLNFQITTPSPVIPANNISVEAKKVAKQQQVLSNNLKTNQGKKPQIDSTNLVLNTAATKPTGLLVNNSVESKTHSISTISTVSVNQQPKISNLDLNYISYPKLDPYNKIQHEQVQKNVLFANDKEISISNLNFSFFSIIGLVTIFSIIIYLLISHNLNFIDKIIINTLFYISKTIPKNNLKLFKKCHI